MRWQEQIWPGTVLRYALVAGLAGCASTGPSRMTYEPPEDAPAGSTVAYVRQPAEMVFNQLLDSLQQSSFKVQRAVPEQGLIVALYSGPPEPYVECGWIVVEGGARPGRIPATASESTFARVVDGYPRAIDRALKLDGRVTLRVRPESRNDAMVEGESVYVLTKRIEVRDSSGTSRGRANEVVSFSTGERGAFSKGTVCQPSGSFEAAVMSALPGVDRLADVPPPPGPPWVRRATIVETELPAPEIAATEPPQPALAAADPQPATSLAAEPVAGPRSVTVGPTCQGEDAVACDLLELIAPYQRANDEQKLGLAVGPLEGEYALLEPGSLGLDVSLPHFDAYLAVSYLRRDGTLGHVSDGSGFRWPANAREFLRTGGNAGADDIAVIVALASETPLFGAPRAPFESVNAYLADLRERLAVLEAEQPSAQIAASHVILPRGRSESGALSTAQ